MQHLIKVLFPLTLCFVSACSNSFNQRLYENIKRQNEVNKSPVERAITPSPSYEDYRKEREGLNRDEPAGKKNPLPLSGIR